MPAEVMKRQHRGSLAVVDPDAGSDVQISAVEVLKQRRHEHDRQKARANWAKLRNSIRHTVDAVADAEKKEVVVTHGIHFVRNINHIEPLVHAMYIQSRKEYVTCDGKNIRSFHEDGRRKDIKSLDEPMNQVMYATLTNQFVGWQQGDDELYLMSEEMNIISQAKAPSAIMLGTYNHNIGEMVTVGPHNITNWGFRYGARHLIPRITAKTHFGIENMFTIMVLEQTASRSQRVFFALHTGVVVFNLWEGKMLCHKKELHVRTITAMTFFNPLKNLVTGSRDGSIKIWDDQYHVKMVFVGHSDCVNALAIYPHGPAIVSASLDGSIRVWNLETSDEVDKVQISEPVEALGTENNYDIFYTWSGRKVELWKLQHLYFIHTAVGSRVASVQMTNHPGYPQRAVLICKDSSIRIISPPSGAVMTSLLMDRAHIIDTAYAIAEDTLFVVLGNGDILKCSTATNPSRIMAKWKCEDPKEICNYLLVYEYVVDYLAKSDVWAVMKRNIATKSMDSKDQGPARGMDRTLLLGGRRDGYICVFNRNTGAVNFKVEAHGSKGVLNLIANSKEDQLISAGMDNVIKIWRLYPYADEALAPLMSFYCAHTPAFMTTIKTDLCVAFQDPSTATFSVVVYNLKDKNRFDHKPDDDHIDVITGLTSCQRMKLYASCSLDGTIRIWNEANRLVRLLKLKAYPYSLGFCSPKGDLLVGVGDHLFHIPYHTYMPKAFRNKMVSMRFIMPSPEEPLPYDEALLSKMSMNEVKRLKYSRSSFKFNHFVDVLSPEEEEEVMRERKEKKEAFSLIDKREGELKMIRDGELKPKRKPIRSKKTEEEAFRNYMKMYYDKPRITVPEDDEYLADSIRRKLEGDEDGEDEEFKPQGGPYGFFNETPYSRQMSAKSSASVSSPLKPGYYPHGPHGYIPNSILIRLLWPEPPSPKPTSIYQPPTFTDEGAPIPSKDTTEEIEEAPEPEEAMDRQRSVTFARTDDMIRVFRWDDGEDEEEDNLGDFYDEKSKEKEKKKKQEKKPEPSPLLSRMQSLLSEKSVVEKDDRKRSAWTRYIAPDTIEFEACKTLTDLADTKDTERESPRRPRSPLKSRMAMEASSREQKKKEEEGRLWRLGGSRALSTAPNGLGLFRLAAAASIARATEDETEDEQAEGGRPSTYSKFKQQSVSPDATTHESTRKPHVAGKHSLTPTHVKRQKTTRHIQGKPGTAPMQLWDVVEHVQMKSISFLSVYPEEASALAEEDELEKQMRETSSFHGTEAEQSAVDASENEMGKEISSTKGDLTATRTGEDEAEKRHGSAERESNAAIVEEGEMEQRDVQYAELQFSVQSISGKGATRKKDLQLQKHGGPTAAKEDGTRKKVRPRDSKKPKLTSKKLEELIDSLQCDTDQSDLEELDAMDGDASRRPSTSGEAIVEKVQDVEKKVRKVSKSHGSRRPSLDFASAATEGAAKKRVRRRSGSHGFVKISFDTIMNEDDRLTEDSRKQLEKSLKEEDEASEDLQSRRTEASFASSTKSPRASPTSSLTQPSSQTSAPPPPKPKPPQPLKPVQKLPPRPKPRVKAPTPTPISPVAQSSPTPPPPPTPLPDFISQFQGTEWFEKYFPNCQENSSAKTWNADTFANMVLKLVRIGDMPVKKAVTEALMLLHTQEELGDQMTHTIFKTLISVLNHYQNPPSCMVEIEKTFILVALRALQIFAGNCVKDLVTELLMQFLDGDREVRATVLDIFSGIGVQDQHRQLQKELDSWDVWNLDESDRKAEIRRMCHQWLDRWMTSYKLHMEDTVERLKKGQNIHGRLPRGQMSKRGKASSGRHSAAGSEGPEHLPEGVDYVPRPGSDRSSIYSSRGGITVTFDTIPDEALIHHATYIDAINYFCEMMTEKELESVRKGKRPHRVAPTETIAEAGPPKNTVLVLPKIPQKSALVRLGESHTSHCRPKHESSLEKDYRMLIAPLRRQPPSWDLSNFTPSINLPMKTVYLNPFPCPIDRMDLRFQEPILITLRTSKKYFIPSQSVVPMEPQVAPSV